jgi:IrrE N-terminal-like domain
MNKKILESRQLLQNPYAYLNDRGGYDAILNDSGSISDFPLFTLLECNRGGSLTNENNQKDIRFSHAEIEQTANELLNKMWKHKSQIWFSDVPVDPMGMRDPLVALRFIGYDYELSESLGQFSKGGKLMEVAGIVDSSSKQVRVSRQFPPLIRNFTAAHELGHAVLHNAKGLHRDRPLDGSQIGNSRESIEIEADKFATYFLMPKKIVIAKFSQIYGNIPFFLNEATIFALATTKSKDLSKECKTLRDLSRILASSEYFNGRHFISLAKQFDVSDEAMAIRLEELKLLEL